MNKRQKKKAYKKRYGHNPPKIHRKHHYTDWGKMVAKAAESVMEPLQTMALLISEMAGNLNRIAKEFTERIQTMPEGEFNRILEREDLDAETKALAWQIRRNWNEQSSIGDGDAGKMYRLPDRE